MRTRPGITLVIGGAVAALLVLAGVDALRSAIGNTFAPTASVPTTKLASGPIATDTRWGYLAPIRQYVLAAGVICGQANADLRRRGVGGANLERIAWWNEVAARAAEKSLRQLRALPAPEADQALLGNFFSGAAEVIDALREVAAAASTGDRRRMSVLIGKQVDAIHRKDARADLLSVRWRLDDLEILRACPVSLSA
jgi:hypothetical protein